MTADNIVLFLINWHKFYGSLKHEPERFNNDISCYHIADLWYSLGEKYDCIEEMETIGI